MVMIPHKPVNRVFTTRRPIDYAHYKDAKYLAIVIQYINLRHRTGAYVYKRCPCPMCQRGEVNARAFAVDRTGGKWYCHSCKKGGTAITLLMQMYGMKVYDAAEMLASLASEPVTYLTR